MSYDVRSLESTCKQFIDSLLASKKFHTLCLNIAEPAFSAEKAVATYLGTLDKPGVEQHHEPSPAQFAELLGQIAGKILVVDFDDLDKHPKCMDLLGEHVRKPDPGGRLVLVSRDWNSDNTPKERELRKFCLFFQQNPEKKPKK
jgi:hypothetical protein